MRADVKVEESRVSVRLLHPGAGRAGGSTFLVLSLLLLLVGASCQGPEPNTQSAPESALRAFHDAVRSGDSARVEAFLTDGARHALGLRAARWAELTGDERPPSSFLLASWAPGEAYIESVERLSTSDDETHLRVRTYLGEEVEVVMLRAPEGWRVRLPELEEPLR